MAILKTRSPAFQFYPDDWLSCEKVSMMPLECEGAYIRLLAYAWRADDCGLPADDAKLSVLSRMGDKWQCDGNAMVRPCFFEKDGRLYNKRLLEERKKQKDYKAKQSKNANSRWHNKLAPMPPQCQNDAVAIPPQCSSSSSSSSTSNKKNTITWMTVYNDSWKAKTGQDLPFSTCARALKVAHDTMGEKDLLASMNAYLQSQLPQFINILKFLSAPKTWIPKPKRLQY